MAFDKSLMSIKTTSVYKCFPEIHRLQHGRQQLLCDSVISHPLVYFTLKVLQLCHQLMVQFLFWVTSK